MILVEWSNRLKTGEREIDQEHWGLFALIKDLDDKILQGCADNSIRATIEALCAYVEVHFEHEERIMEEVDYPERESHILAHKALARQVGIFAAQYKKSPKTFDSHELMEFLSVWLNEHIMKLDMDFATFHNTKPD